MWRASRSIPGVGLLLSRLDRIWWERTIRRADVIDLDFVERQLGRRVSEAAATRRYVGGGFQTGLSLNPLFLERHVSQQLPDSARVPALYAYLVADAARISTTAAWDAPAYADAHPESVDAPGGPLGAAWRELVGGEALDLGGTDAPRLVTRDQLLSSATAALGNLPRVPGLIAAPIGPAIAWNLDRTDDDGTGLQTLLDVARDVDATVLLGVREAPPGVRVAAAQLALALPRVHVLDARLTLDAASRALPHGTVLVMRAPGAVVSAASLHALITAARERPTAALWLAPDGTIASAGASSSDGHDSALFAGHPVEDLREQDETLLVGAMDSPVIAQMVGDEAAPATLLSATAVSATPPLRASAPIRRTAPEKPLGRGLTMGPPVRRTSETFVLDDGTRVPRLRWAVKTAAPAGARGQAWGDTHFARGIADALERLGQYAAVDALPAAHRTTSAYDDVHLVLRGPERIDPPPRGTAVIWIISHPDQITTDELSRFSLRYAASLRWSSQSRARFGLDVSPLAQCTDTTRFVPYVGPRTDDLVFVGTARGIVRPAVVVPVDAGAPVRVYGPDWRGYIRASAIAATHLPNDELPRVYGSAGAVLNDHWPAMRREGFVSNRLYDVVAAGGRAISDEVEGIAETFGPAVRMFRSDDELREISTSPLASIFPDDDVLAEITARVRREHSFDARARTLLLDVLAQREA